jgi:hypothetical protein
LFVIEPRFFFLISFLSFASIDRSIDEELCIDGSLEIYDYLLCVSSESGAKAAPKSKCNATYCKAWLNFG